MQFIKLLKEIAGRIERRGKAYCLPVILFVGTFIDAFFFPLPVTTLYTSLLVGINQKPVRYLVLVKYLYPGVKNILSHNWNPFVILGSAIRVRVWNIKNLTGICACMDTKDSA